MDYSSFTNGIDDISNLLRTRGFYFSVMNRSLDYELQTHPSLGETALRCRARLPVISLGRIKRGNGDPGGRTTPSWPFRSRRFAASARQSIAGRSPNLYDLAVRQQRHLVQWLTSPPLVFRTAVWTTAKKPDKPTGSKTRYRRGICASDNRTNIRDSIAHRGYQNKIKKSFVRSLTRRRQIKSEF